jgi:hypothetical protein
MNGKCIVFVSAYKGSESKPAAPGSVILTPIWGLMPERRIINGQIADGFEVGKLMNVQVNEGKYSEEYGLAHTYTPLTVYSDAKAEDITDDMDGKYEAKFGKPRYESQETSNAKWLKANAAVEEKPVTNPQPKED